MKIISIFVKQLSSNFERQNCEKKKQLLGPNLQLLIKKVYFKSLKINKREEAVAIYTKSLRCLWIQAFGDRHVIFLSSLAKQQL